MKKDIIDVTLNVEPSYTSNLDAKVEVRCRGELVNDLIKIAKTRKPIKTVEQAILNAFFENSKVERVIFNGPATIVFWDDGEKTVVKCRECSDGKCIHDDGVAIEDLPDFAQQVCASLDNISRCIVCARRFDPEKAVMAAMLKRLYKNYQDVLREALGDVDE